MLLLNMHVGWIVMFTVILIKLQVYNCFTCYSFNCLISYDCEGSYLLLLIMHVGWTVCLQLYLSSSSYKFQVTSYKLQVVWQFTCYDFECIVTFSKFDSHGAGCSSPPYITPIFRLIGVREVESRRSQEHMIP